MDDFPQLMSAEELDEQFNGPKTIDDISADEVTALNNSGVEELQLEPLDTGIEINLMQAANAPKAPLERNPTLEDEQIAKAQSILDKAGELSLESSDDEVLRIQKIKMAEAAKRADALKTSRGGDDRYNFGADTIGR